MFEHCNYDRTISSFNFFCLFICKYQEIFSCFDPEISISIYFNRLFFLFIISYFFFRSKSRSVDHGLAAPFDLDSLRSKVEGRFDSVERLSKGLCTDNGLFIWYLFVSYLERTWIYSVNSKCSHSKCSSNNNNINVISSVCALER